MTQKDFLVELGTEELPPKALAKLAKAFYTGVVEGLAKANLGHGEAKWYAAPRRLAVLVTQLDEGQQDQLIEKRGPAIQAAYKEDGCPTPAAEGFARSCGTTVDKLEKLKTDKGEWLAYKVEQKGEKTSSLLPDIITQSLNKLPVPKRMRWGNSTHDFVRPVHWLVALMDSQIVDMELFGHKASNTTFGHRFHAPEAITIPHPADYENLLESQGKVLVDFDKRRNTIRAQVEEAAINNKGKAVIDDDLLTEVTGLVEWPVAVVGKFEERYLDVPGEALISAMKGHQKYFHMVNGKGALMPNFITVSNIESKNVESVRDGNERVIRPRLSDAEFFWQQDNKHKLESYRSQLDKVVFQNKLGSVGEKITRVENLSKSLADILGFDTTKAARAAKLSKCDLMSEMVGEFPELQGTMGKYYAQRQGEDAEVATAISEQYLPRFSGDVLPETNSGAVVSIADKLDTTIGIFGIGQAPTGDKDPFALRRSVIGLLRIIIEKNLQVNIRELIKTSIDAYGSTQLEKTTGDDVYQFILDRLKGYYADQGVSYDVYEAVALTRPEYLSDMQKRISAIENFKQREEAASLAGANKRINNILKKAKPSDIGKEVKTELLKEPAEKALNEALEAAIKESANAIETKDYDSTLSILARLKDPVDAFFDNVMVNSEDADEKANRLSLLSRLSQQFLSIADIGQLQIK